MDCEHALEAISAALDGELPQSQWVKLEAHLSSCPSCRALAEDLRALTAALEESDEAPPPELSARVMERVAADRAAPRSNLGGRLRRRRWTGLAAMLALVACVGGLGLWLTNGGIRAGSGNSTESGASYRMTQTAPGEAAGPAADAAPACEGEDGASGSAESVPSAAPGAPNDNGAEPAMDSPQPCPAPVPSSSVSWGEEPVNYAFTNVQAIQIDADGSAEAPTARVLGSVQAVQSFAEEFPGDDLETRLAGYDAGYFQKSRLLAVVVTEEDSAVSYEISNVSWYHGPEYAVTKQVEVVRGPQEADGSAAGWIILAEVDTMFEDGEVLNVVLEYDGD